MAAAGLLIDYVMTVAVSIASGVAAITSAYPPMQLATVWIGVGVIVILLAGNLRGVRQAGAGAKAASLPRRAWLVKQGGSGPSRPRTAPRGIIAAAWCQAAGRAQLGGDAAARASAQARASAASSTAASARSMAQAA